MDASIEGLGSCATSARRVTAAHFIAAGANEVEAAEACILAPLSTDGAISEGLREIAAAGLLAVDTL